MTVLSSTDEGRRKLMQRVARLRREKRLRFWRAFAVTAFFVVALSGNLLIGAAVVNNNLSNLLTFNWGKSEEPSHIARIRRTMLDGTFCRNIVFDNTTAQSVTDKVERCDGGPKQPKVDYTPPTQFKWGNH